MGLGTLRFILSLLVIDAHYGIFATHAQAVAVARFGIERMAYVGSGGIAVTGFFVISGYLIALVLARKYDSGWRGARAFYLSRAVRIYPLYWLVFAAYWLALAALKSPPALDAGRLFGNIALVPYGVIGIVADRNGPGVTNLTETMLIGPAWTLAYDLVFYALAPWLLMSRRRTWWVAGIGVAYFIAFIVFADPRPPVWYQFFYETGTPYLFMFACGALAYHYRDALRFGPAAAALCLAALAWITWFPLGLPNTFVNHLLAALLFTLLVASIGGKPHAPRMDRLLGDLTYATYLLHLPLLVIVQRLGWPAPALWAFALTYAGALLLLLVWELPLDRVRDRLYERAKQKVGMDVRPAPAAIPPALVVTMALAAGVALYHNLWRAGDRVVMHAVACPEHWQCDQGRLAFDGADRAVLAPVLPIARRIVADLELDAGAGDAWAGFVTTDATTRAGIVREGDRCHLEIEVEGRVERDPEGWNMRCRKHRFVFDRVDGRLRVAVDSLWLRSLGGGETALTATVSAGANSRGAAGFNDVFETRR